jgi:hypothetical protein
MTCECSVIRKLTIERVTLKAYEQLACWHYRGARLGPYTAIFGAKAMYSNRWAAVIVYAMPAINSQLRAAAMAGDVPVPAATGERIKWLNANLRCIARVIVEPRYRGVGLAARLVSETLPLAGVPFVEALAAMGHVNPFFEKAGMRRFDGLVPHVQPRLVGILEKLGIPRCLFVDPRAVHQRIDGLPGELRMLAEAEIRLFLKRYVKRRDMEHSIERTRFVLSRLQARPVYYLWQRPAGSLSSL